MSCQWQKGLLVMRACGEPASAACGMCGRQLCASHVVNGQQGPACPQCVANHPGYPQNEHSSLAASREAYYRPFGGTAAMGLGALGLGAAGLGAASFFSGDESAALNQPGAVPRRPRPEEYDAMET